MMINIMICNIKKNMFIKKKMIKYHILYFVCVDYLFNIKSLIFF